MQLVYILLKLKKMITRTSSQLRNWRWLQSTVILLGIVFLLLFAWIWSDSSKVFRQIDVQLQGYHIYLSSYGGRVGFAYSNIEGVGNPVKWGYYSEEFGLSKYEFPAMIARKHAPEDMDADFETFLAYWFVGIICILLFFSTIWIIKIRGWPIFR